LRSIVLKGNPDAVAECKRMIDEVISIKQQLQNQASGLGVGAKSSNQKELDNPYVLKVTIPNEKVGVIIGKMGATIRGIQERTKATVQIPSNPDEGNPSLRTLSIGGDTKEAVEAAQAEISNCLMSQTLPANLIQGLGMTMED
jgi:far upstream element-binding protein